MSGHSANRLDPSTLPRAIGGAPGLPDRAVGGLGMRLERRDPDHLRVGDGLNV